MSCLVLRRSSCYLPPPNREQRSGASLNTIVAFSSFSLHPITQYNPPLLPGTDYYHRDNEAGVPAAKPLLLSKQTYTLTSKSAANHISANNRHHSNIDNRHRLTQLTSNWAFTNNFKTFNLTWPPTNKLTAPIMPLKQSVPLIAVTTLHTSKADFSLYITYL